MMKHEYLTDQFSVSAGYMALHWPADMTAEDIDMALEWLALRSRMMQAKAKKLRAAEEKKRDLIVPTDYWPCALDGAGIH